MAYTTLYNLDRIDPAELFKQEVFENIKYQSFYFIESVDGEGAVRYAKVLESALGQAEAQKQPNSLLYGILVFWMLRLKLFGFDSLEQQDKLDLLKKYIIDILDNDLDFKAAILRDINIFEGTNAITERTTDFLNALTKSQVSLGSNIEAFKKNNFQPSVNNWLKHYQYSINKRDAGKSLGAFDEISFINNEVNTKFLDSNEREILKRLLELYNWLLSPIIYVDQKKEIPASSFITKEKLQLPNEIIRPVSSLLPPAVPAPKNAPVMKGMGEVTQISNDKFQIAKGTQGASGQVSKDSFPMPQKGIVNPPRLGGEGVEAGIRKDEVGVRNGIQGNKALISNDKSQILNRDQGKTVSNGAQGGDVYIDRKLEDLERRTKS